MSIEQRQDLRCDIFKVLRDVRECSITLLVNGESACVVRFDAGKRGRDRAIRMIRAAAASPVSLREARQVLARAKGGEPRDS